MAGSFSRPLLPSAQIPYRHRAREILDSLRLSLPTVAPGQTPGALRFVSPALHILRIRAKGTAGSVSARKVSDSTNNPETRLLYSITAISRRQPRKAGSTQQAWINSRNQTTIATRSKHRQHVFLHPTEKSREARLQQLPQPAIADSGSSLYTTSFPTSFDFSPRVVDSVRNRKQLKRGAWVGSARVVCSWQWQS
jgi:hypothetical protein